MKLKLLIFLLGTGFLLSGNTLPSEQRKNSKLMQAALEPVRAALQISSAVFYDGKTRTPFIYGTVVGEDGWILTKASELEGIEKMTVRVDRQNFRNPQVVARNERWDLALVKVEASDLSPVVWADSSALPHGSWVISNGATTRSFRRPRAGIISANKRAVTEGHTAVLGVGLKSAEEGIKITMITEKSGAEEAGVMKGDIIKKADSQEVSKVQDFQKILLRYKVGQTIKLELLRGEELLSLEVELMARHQLYGNAKSRNDMMSGGDMQLSRRRTNFPMVLQHEITLSKRTVGGPLLDLEGKCLGLNIAYANRVENFAIPVENLLKELPDLMKQAAEHLGE